MKRHLLALLLAFLLISSALIPPVLAGDATNTAADDVLIAALKDFFAGAEGDYDAVNANDGGAPSLGLLQWHGARALELLRFTLDGWPVTANYLTSALYREITASGTSWRNRVLTKTEAQSIAAMLGSKGGRAAQDALSRRDILSYVTLCRQWGMATDATAAYFAVIINQFGAGGAASYLRHIRQTLGVGEDAVFTDLTALHQAVHDTTSYGQRYLAMRDKSYAYIQSLGWDLTGKPRTVRRRLPPSDGPLSLLADRLNLRACAEALLRGCRTLLQGIAP